MANRQSKAGTIGGVVFLLFMFVMIWVIFKAVSGIFWILSVIAPIMLIFALFMNHTVVTDYVRWLFKLLKEDTGKGLLFTLGTFIGYPLVAAYLALKAYTKRSLGSKRNPKEKDKEGDYIKYEEVQEKEEDFLDLGDLDKTPQKQAQTRDNTYDDLFS